jgi:CdiI immunity protein
MSTFEGLTHFCSCYLNQDWELEYKTESEAVSDFLNGEANEKIVAVWTEASRLLENCEESELRKILHQSGLGFNPLPSFGSYTNWLTSIKVRLEAIPHKESI